MTRPCRTTIRNRLPAILVAAALATGCGDGGGAGAAIDAVYPPAVDGARDIVDTTLAVDLAARGARATLTVAASTSTGLSLEIGDLEVTSVTLGGRPLLWVDAGKRIDIGVPPSTSPFAVVIDYTWRFHDAFDGVATNGYTLTWPYHCGNVFPCRSAPSDGTTFHLSVTGAPAGTPLYPAEIPADAPSYMAAWIVDDFTRLELGRTTAGTRVAIWHRGDEAAAAASGGAHLRASFDWMERNLGPYRFGDEVGSVSARWGPGAYGGMEHHPMWHVSSASLADAAANVHEAAHGWFGNGVRLRCWEDFVLSEGTVEYLKWRVLDEVAPAGVADRVWAGYASELEVMRGGQGNGVAWPQGCGQIDILRDGLFSRVPYVKGAYFYRAVADRVGRPALDEALRSFYGRWRGRAAGMGDMLDTIREVTGFDADSCARLWLRSANLPAGSGCP